jgi:hypothetical protein
MLVWPGLPRGYSEIDHTSHTHANETRFVNNKAAQLQ